MSRRGNYWDNAVTESFFSSLKKERIKKHIYKDRDTAASDISDSSNRFTIAHAATVTLAAVQSTAQERTKGG